MPSAALLARRAALGGGFDESMRVAEDVDLVWRLAAAGWRIRYEPRRRGAARAPGPTTEWLRRRAFYGTGAALLAARHGAAVAPLVIAPTSAAVWALLLAGGRPGRTAAAGILAVDTVRLARRLAAPGQPPEHPPWRPGWCSGERRRPAVRWPGRSPGTTGRWRCWRWAPGGCAVPVVAAAWSTPPSPGGQLRGRIGPARFAAARRLDDLAYGAGLWWGAARAGSRTALLPARPPQL